MDRFTLLMDTEALRLTKAGKLPVKVLKTKDAIRGEGGEMLG
jgi:hypothetical protein